MRHEKFIVAEKKRGRLLMVCVVSILCLSEAALGQSGRRQSRNPSTPATVVTENKTADEPQPSPPAQKSAPAATFIVGGDRLGTSLYVLPGYVQVAAASCVDRLRKYAGLEAIAGGNMTRRAAIDRAKKEKDAHVVWLEIKAGENGSRGGTGSDEISIAYTVFTPQTAKVLTSGRVYLGSRRAGVGGVGIGVPSISGRFPLEYQLKEAGENVADRVKNKFPLGPTD